MGQLAVSKKFSNYFNCLTHIHEGLDGGVSGIHYSLKRASFMVKEINMGVCPRLEFDNIMHIYCLWYD